MKTLSERTPAIAGRLTSEEVDDAKHRNDPHVQFPNQPFLLLQLRLRCGTAGVSLRAGLEEVLLEADFMIELLVAGHVA